MHHLTWYKRLYKNKYFFLSCYKLDRHLSWNRHHHCKPLYDMLSTLTTSVCSHLWGCHENNKKENTLIRSGTNKYRNKIVIRERTKKSNNKRDKRNKENGYIPFIVFLGCRLFISKDTTRIIPTIAIDDVQGKNY